jgi:hypothetical protein
MEATMIFFIIRRFLMKLLKGILMTFIALCITVSLVSCALVGGESETKAIADLMEKVKEDYADYYGFDRNCVVIGRYYGSFGDAVVFYVWGDGFDEASCETEVYVAGIEFVFHSSRELCVWYDGKIYSLNQAYDGGMLTRENIVELANIHKNMDYVDLLKKSERGESDE